MDHGVGNNHNPKNHRIRSFRAGSIFRNFSFFLCYYRNEDTDVWESDISKPCDGFITALSDSTVNSLMSRLISAQGNLWYNLIISFCFFTLLQMFRITLRLNQSPSVKASVLWRRGPWLSAVSSAPPCSFWNLDSSHSECHSRPPDITLLPPSLYTSHSFYFYSTSPGLFWLPPLHFSECSLIPPKKVTSNLEVTYVLFSDSNSQFKQACLCCFLTYDRYKE